MSCSLAGSVGVPSNFEFWILILSSSTWSHFFLLVYAHIYESKTAKKRLRRNFNLQINKLLRLFDFFLWLLIIGLVISRCVYIGWRWMDAFWKPINSSTFFIPSRRLCWLSSRVKESSEWKRQRAGGFDTLERGTRQMRKEKNVISTDKNNTLSVTKRTENCKTCELPFFIFRLWELFLSFSLLFFSLGSEKCECSIPKPKKKPRNWW